jgi:hypothetical protein
MKYLKINKFGFPAVIVVLVLLYLVLNSTFDNPFKTDTSESLQDQQINEEAEKILQTLLAEIETEPAVKKGPEKKVSTPEPMYYEKKLALVDAGKKLIGDNNEKIRGFPVIIAGHDRSCIDTPGFFAALAKLGCQFYIYDKKKDIFISKVDTAGKSQVSKRSFKQVLDLLLAEFGLKQMVSKESFKGLSPRRRPFSLDATVESYITSAEQKYGPGDYQLTLMVPLEMDQYLIGALQDVARKKDTQIKEFWCFYGTYKPFDQGLVLNIHTGRRKPDWQMPLDVSIKLPYEK